MAHGPKETDHGEHTFTQAAEPRHHSLEDQGQLLIHSAEMLPLLFRAKEKQAKVA